MALQSKNGQEFLKKNHQMLQKADSQTPTKFLVCCFVVIRIER
jgi:hypothetical protein